MRPERGFALVAALFVIVVIALVIAAMSRLSVTQNASLDLAIQQARAYQAAQAGLEWGLHKLMLDGTCPSAPGATVSMVGSGLADFTVGLVCTRLHSYLGEGIDMYRLIATAGNGTPDSRADYAWRQLEVTVERSND